jgi:hypothetical protein
VNGASQAIHRTAYPWSRLRNVGGRSLRSPDRHLLIPLQPAGRFACATPGWGAFEKLEVPALVVPLGKNEYPILHVLRRRGNLSTECGVYLVCTAGKIFGRVVEKAS